MFQALAMVCLFLSAQGTSGSQDHESRLLPRDVCDGIDGMPILYHDYQSDVCRPKYVISSKGVCDHSDFQSNACVAFCQLRTRFVYGREFPLGIWCDGPPCKIENFTKTMTWSVDMSPQFEKGLDDGISGGWQSKITSDVGPRGMSHEVPLNEGHGTLSHQKTRANRCMNYMHTIQNYCVDDLRRYSDSTVDGETIFVYTDCMTRRPLPMDQQSSTYSLPGVALDWDEHSSVSALGGLSVITESRQEVL
ncbi:uncharacterized protein N7500_008714 [Penicillium coprophilum]|uniref:uncharacterized protein n=1 Tax=Penicillium coprophilum TaxID=36646 RepID=UPI00238ECB54|nr:uncharacterized protein N7500_008714 [Penicillium coprophilum]KAJ5159063.1 hypothetical protein N7500_008714 [Penicillium coprophilum]